MCLGPCLLHWTLSENKSNTKMKPVLWYPKHSPHINEHYDCLSILILFCCYSRVAVNKNHYLSQTLGIRNTVNKKKLSLKAMDVVLFGPTPSKHTLYQFLESGEKAGEFKGVTLSGVCSTHILFYFYNILLHYF